MKRRAPAPEIALLLRNLEDGYRRKAWHGPNLRGSLRGLTAPEAAWRPSPRRHNIWELAVHAAYWKYAVRRLLTGEKRGTFVWKGSNWFPAPSAPSARAWTEARRLLDAEHRKLRDAVARLSPPDLSVRPRGSKREIATLVYGAAAHDVYHAGQIQLLKVLRRGKHGR